MTALRCRPQDLLVFCLVLTASIMSARPSSAQSLCLPTCNPADGRFFAVVGGRTGPPVFGNFDMSVRILSPATASTFEVHIFDGDAGRTDGQGRSHWDAGTVASAY